MITYALLIIITGITIHYVIKALRFRRMLNVFPGRNDGHLIFGDAWFFNSDSNSNFRLFRDYTRRFPNSYRIWSFLHGVICINTPEHAEVILSSPKHIQKSIIYTILKPWLKTGLLTSTGEKWFHRRKLLTPAFHFNILKKLTEHFEEHNNYLIEQLKDGCKNNEINIVPLISKVALNLICATSMGVRLQPTDKKQIEYRKAIYGFSAIFTERLTKPWLLFESTFMLFPIYKIHNKIVEVLHQFTNDIIKEKENNFYEDEFDENDTYSKKRLAMLDLLISAKKKRGEITSEGIQEEVDTFTFEGHDTVAMALSFSLLLLASQKEHQKKIFEEIDNIFQGSDRACNYEDLLNMPYLELCLKECLRLYPSVPLISRYAGEDIPLDDKLIIPAGSIVHVHIYDIHRNEKHYPNPEKFDPERFLPENFKNRHPYAYIPFSAGPRNCIGQKYAMLELKSIISNILRHYEMEPVDKISDIILDLELVLRPRNGIKIKFIPREM